MLATIFLLGLVYVVLIAVLIAAGVGVVAVAVIAGLLFLVQYFSSDKLALRSMGAQEVSAQEAPELHATIERLCIQANLPMPPMKKKPIWTMNDAIEAKKLAIVISITSRLATWVSS